MSKARELLELIKYKKNISSKAGRVPHTHDVFVDEAGDGQTGPSSNGPRHQHSVVGAEILPAGNSDPLDPKHIHVYPGHVV